MVAQWGAWAGGGGDILQQAVNHAFEPISKYEDKESLKRIEKKVCKYFREAAGTMKYKPSMSVAELMYQFCDRAFGPIVTMLGEYTWLNEVDFLWVVAAGVQVGFPPALMTSVSPQELENAVTQAHDRAYEEHRFANILWDVITEHVRDPQRKKKCCDALEEGRRLAVNELYAGYEGGTPMDLDKFISVWIRKNVEQIAAAMGGPGYAYMLVTLKQSKAIFHALVEAGTLPVPLVAYSGQPPPKWSVIDKEAKASYVAVDGEWNDAWISEGGLGQGGGDWKGKKRKRS